MAKGFRRKSRNLVASEHPLNLFLVTAQHVALDMKSQRTVTIRGDNDTPINMKLEDLVGERDVRWVSHDKEDVAVVILRPTGITTAVLKGHFMPIRMLVSDDICPSHDRPPYNFGISARYWHTRTFLSNFAGIETSERIADISSSGYAHACCVLSAR